jgi:hypothetical protein
MTAACRVGGAAPRWDIDPPPLVYGDAFATVRSGVSVRYGQCG